MPLTRFSDLQDSTLAPSSPSSSPRRRTPKSWARKVERCCCTSFMYFPLVFVHGLTTWAIWVEVTVSFLGFATWFSFFKAGLGLVLWTLLNVSYSIAVFTSPGSPLDRREDWSGRKGRGYEGLPTYEEDEVEGGEVPAGMTMVTAKSTGKPRYCKKCQSTKPDRAHHCSSCGRCVLKMDHHCPWLATCVGLRNYKAFVLFLIYTSLFCWVCFAVSAGSVYAELSDDVQMTEGLRVVNTILLAVLGGIIGLVLSGFTGWHLYLAFTNQTTIESLEKTRYLSPLRKSMEANNHRAYLHENHDPNEEQSLADRMKEIHANALPGVLRPEEGEDSRDPSRGSSPLRTSAVRQTSSSPAQTSLQRSYASMEAQREQERYDAYLDEQDSEKLPNAFDMGWRNNLTHLFGSRPIFWFLPVCNTSGDGWAWTVSPKWVEARDEVARNRAHKAQEDAMFRDLDSASLQSQPRFFQPPQMRKDFRWTPGQGFVNHAPAPPPPPPANAGYNQHSSHSSDTDMQLQPLDRRKTPTRDVDAESYDTSSDEDVKRMYEHPQIYGTGGNWNDVPEEFLGPGRGKSKKGRRKGD